MNDFSCSKASYDPSMDLNYDGIIDFLDFSILADGWIRIYNIYDLNTMCSAWATMDCCIDINNFPNPADNTNWEDVIFIGIGPCGWEDCWIWDEYYSHPYWDGCVNKVIVGCVETSEFGGHCAYNFFYNGSSRVGLCVYGCGWNDFEVLRNTDGCRFIFSRHRTRDVPPQDPCCFPNCNPICDEGTVGYYNWQVVNTCLTNQVKVGYCRQSVTEPNYVWGWQITEGQEGPCACHWWPY
jgi:hypothetical protein